MNTAKLSVNARITDPMPSPYSTNCQTDGKKSAIAIEPPITVMKIGSVQLSDAVP